METIRRQPREGLYTRALRVHREEQAAREQAMAEQGTDAPAVPVETNGNGKRQARLDWLLGGTMLACLLAAAGITVAQVATTASGGQWQAATDMRNQLVQFARDILIGYLAVSAGARAIAAKA